jgi:hypothetical protein
MEAVPPITVEGDFAAQPRALKKRSRRIILVIAVTIAGSQGQYVGFMRNNAYSRSQGSLLPAGDLDNIQVMVIRSERDAVTLIHVDCNQTARC